MLTEQEQEMHHIVLAEQATIRLLSETELYPQAVQFMRGIANVLPQKQTNGLLNVSLANTYNQLLNFVEHQRKRTTWPPKERHIETFYHTLGQKLKGLEAYVPSIMKARKEQPSPEDVQMLKMLLAREFIQHVLAENAYMGAIRTTQNTEHNTTRDQGKPQGNNRGPARRQERR